MTNRDPDSDPDPDRVDAVMRLIQYALFAVVVVSIALLVSTEPPVGWVP